MLWLILDVHLLSFCNYIDNKWLARLLISVILDLMSVVFYLFNFWVINPFLPISTNIHAALCWLESGSQSVCCRPLVGRKGTARELKEVINDVIYIVWVWTHWRIYMKSVCQNFWLVLYSTELNTVGRIFCGMINFWLYSDIRNTFLFFGMTTHSGVKINTSNETKPS